jgi:hypothetical protein
MYITSLLTIYASLILFVREVIFFMQAKHIVGEVERFFEGAKTFKPPNCPEFGSRGWHFFFWKARAARVRIPEI